MKKYFTLLALALVTLVSCDKDEPGETPKKEYDVYIAGLDMPDGGSSSNVMSAVYWKNGAKVILSTDVLRSGCNSIVVSNGDVYVSGYKEKGKHNDLAVWRAVYWKNGELIELPDDNSISAEAASMCVVGNDIYVAGGLGDPETDEYYPVYWKNGELVELTGGVSGAISICVEDGNVYVLDQKGYWKNGIRTELPFKKGYATDMTVVGNDVYISGAEYHNVDDEEYTIARYWKNGNPVTLSQGQYHVEPTSIFVSQDNVYVSGVDKMDMQQNVAYATYWKNGEPVYLSDNQDFYTAESIYVLDNNVFVTGDCEEGTGYWVNGEFHPADELFLPNDILAVERK